MGAISPERRHPSVFPPARTSRARAIAPIFRMYFDISDPIGRHRFIERFRRRRSYLRSSRSGDFYFLAGLSEVSKIAHRARVRIARQLFDAVRTLSSAALALFFERLPGSVGGGILTFRDKSTWATDGPFSGLYNRDNVGYERIGNREARNTFSEGAAQHIAMSPNPEPFHGH